MNIGEKKKLIAIKEWADRDQMQKKKKFDCDKDEVDRDLSEKFSSLTWRLIAIKGVVDRDQMQYFGRFLLLSFYWDFGLGSCWDGS